MIRIAFLSGAEMCLFSWSGTQLSLPLVFDATSAGYARFAQCLRNQRKSPIQLLADVAEEEFREQAVPCVYGLERRELWRTRGRRLFGDNLYYHAQFQEREVSGRRNDRVLFSTLNRAEQWLSPLLLAITEQDIPLIGISSLPLLTTRMLHWLSIENGPALLISLQRSGNLRQIFFQQQRLKLSRLAICPLHAAIDRAEFVHRELINIRDYLHSSELLASNADLPVYILANPALHHDLVVLNKHQISIRYILLDVALQVQRLTKRPHLRGDMQVTSEVDDPRGGSGGTAELLFALWACKKGIPNHYASMQQRYHYWLPRIKHGLLTVSFTILLGSLGYGTWQALQGFRLKSDIAALKESWASYNTRYQALKDSLPLIPIPSAQLQEIEQLAKLLEQRRADPLAMMQILSHGFAATEGLSIQRLTWTLSTDATPQLTSQAVPMTREDGLSVTPLYQIAIVEGEVNVGIDYRLAIERVTHFANVLRALPGVALVEVLSLPFSLNTPRAVDSEGARRSRFKVRLALRSAATDPKLTLQ